MRKKYISFIVATSFVVAMVFTLNLQTDGTSVFPEHLGDLTLDNVEIGEKAMESTKRLHGFSSELKMKGAYIADYYGARGTSARIWIAEAESHDQAYQLLQSMTRKIDPTDGFTKPETVALPKIKRPLVYHVEGFGSHHYYYVKKSRVYWIALTDISFSRQIDFVEEAIINIA